MAQKDVKRMLVGFAIGLAVAAAGFKYLGTPSHAAEAPPPAKTDQIAALKAEVDHLKGMVPDQSHAMTDVAIQYSNLWFAGEQQNWPLAQFCFDETRSHLRWAVRIIPVRKNLKGEPVDLTQIFAAIDSTNLKALGQTIAAKDKTQFEGAYRNMLDSCYACHLGADKPYLRLQVPQQPALPVLNFTEKK